MENDPKAELQHYLGQARDALLWKLDGLAEYDSRRPLTPTGTNLLGLLKHVASVVFGYFGEVFDRRADEPLPWLDEGAEVNADMYATAERGEVTLRRIIVHVIAETDRHAGHADVLRELIDGEAGMRQDNDNLPEVDSAWWSTYRGRLERIAQGTQ